MGLTGFRQVTNAGHGFVIASGGMRRRIEKSLAPGWTGGMVSLDGRGGREKVLAERRNHGCRAIDRERRARQTS